MNWRNLKTCGNAGRRLSAPNIFIRQNYLNDTFNIAKILVHDKHDLIQKAVGSWIREAGKRNKKMLQDFLSQYAPTMPRTMLRYAIEKLDKKQKDFYMNAGTCFL